MIDVWIQLMLLLDATQETCFFVLLPSLRVHGVVASQLAVHVRVCFCLDLWLIAFGVVEHLFTTCDGDLLVQVWHVSCVTQLCTLNDSHKGQRCPLGKQQKADCRNSCSPADAMSRVITSSAGCNHMYHIRYVTQLCTFRRFSQTAKMSIL